MKTIVNTARGCLELKEVALPDPAKGWVRVRTRACEICATDLEMLSGWDRTGFPSIPGHEWSGTVDVVGRAAFRAVHSPFDGRFFGQRDHGPVHIVLVRDSRCSQCTAPPQTSLPGDPT